MNAVVRTSGMSKRVYRKQKDLDGQCVLLRRPGNISGLYSSFKTSTSFKAKLTADYIVAMPVLSGKRATERGPRSAIAMEHLAVKQERLICAAETTLASQTDHTYRRWYFCWRCRGVRANDLLDMTWAWCQRV